jgi:hypothetical protein
MTKDSSKREGHVEAHLIWSGVGLHQCVQDQEEESDTLESGHDLVAHCVAIFGVSVGVFFSKFLYYGISDDVASACDEIKVRSGKEMG